MENTEFKLTIRAVEPSDIDFLYRIENLPEIWRISFGDALLSRQLIWDYINSYSADLYADRQLRLILDIDNKPVGTVDISDYDPRNRRALIGIALEREYRGRGIGYQALTRVIERCRDTFGMHQLAALVPKDNVESMQLFSKLGFKTTGCLQSWLRRGKQYVDVVVYQLLF